MILTEDTLLKLLNGRRVRMGRDLLIKSDNPVSYWDAESKELIVEMKSRRRHYDEQWIEVKKINRLIAAGKEKQKLPVLVISTPKGVWAYDVFLIAKNAKIDAIETVEEAVMSVNPITGDWEEVWKEFYVLQTADDNLLANRDEILKYAIA